MKTRTLLTRRLLLSVAASMLLASGALAQGERFEMQFDDGRTVAFAMTNAIEMTMEFRVGDQGFTSSMEFEFGANTNLTPTGADSPGVTSLKLENRDVKAEWDLSGPNGDVHVTLDGADVLGTHNGVTTIDTRNDIGLTQAKELKRQIAPLYLSGELDLSHAGAAVAFRGDLPFTEFWEEANRYQVGFFGIVFPDQAVEPGDVWTEERTHDTFGEVRVADGRVITLRYRFEREADAEGQAVFSGLASLEEDALTGVLNQGGQDVRVEIQTLDVETTGTYRMDAGSGLPSHVTNRAEVALDMGMSAPDGQNVYMSMKMTADVRYVRIAPDSDP